MGLFHRSAETPPEDHEPLFRLPVTDTEEDEAEDWPEAPAQERAWRHESRDTQERKLRRRDRLRMVSGINDLLLVLLGTAAVLVLIALIVSLIHWVYTDITGRFTILQHLQ